MGTPRKTGPFVDAEPARQHVRELMAGGAAYARIAATAPVATAVINHMLYDHGKPRSATLNHENARRILAVRLDQVATGFVPSTGSSRRIQALMVNGWPPSRVAPYTHTLSADYVKAVQYRPTVKAGTAHGIAVAYNQLWNLTPEHHGVSQQVADRIRTYARTKAFAPPGAWDDDAIDDPTAHPDWTGHCGTDRGWWTHRLENLPMCPRCDTAHHEWKQARQGLSRGELMTALAAARSGASHRGADIADDGRELLRHGCDYDTAAARIGITRQHLQQELQRHPEQVAA